MFLRFFGVVCICLSSCAYASKETLSLTILSYNADVTTVLLYKSILEEMSGQLDHYDFDLTVTDAEHLDQSVAQGAFDFALLDPVHFLQFRSAGLLGGNLATLRRGYQDTSTSLLGGVIFTRREVMNVGLENISQSSVAATSPSYLENYIAQIYELKSLGYSYPSTQDLMLYETPEQVVKAVLEGKQEVGFVRTGVIERLVEQKQLNMNDVRVLNAQSLSGYPFVVSTRLYPEWGFVANAKVSSEVARAISNALLSLSAGGVNSKKYGIYGFVPSLSYMPVEEVLTELGLSPYENKQLSWVDLFKEYAFYFLLTCVVVLALIYLSWHTYRQNQHLTRLVRKEKLAQAMLSESNQQLDRLLSSSPAVIYSLDPEHYQITYVSSNCFQLYHKYAKDVRKIHNWWQNAIHYEDLEHTLATFRKWRANGFKGTLVFSYRLVRDEDWIWVEDRIQALRNDQGEVTLLVGAHSDITKRHLNEEQLELWASVFANAREGIAITNPNGSILDVNAAFSRITGYKRNEILGQNPRILNSGRQSKEFYQEMWQQILSAGFWEGEIWNKRKDGSIYAQNLTVVSVNDSEGDVSHYISLFSDITRQKKNEEQLEHIAYFDALTGLPNRTNLTHSLDIKIHNSALYGTKFALSFLDLDGFKEVNDTFGHETGDLLLVNVAKRMRTTLGDESIVSRFGGDEFVLLLPILDDTSEVEEKLRRLLVALSDPFKVSGVTLHISASIGVTYYPQRRMIEADQLIRQADQAMYQAKISGRNRLKAFDSSQEDILVEQHRFYEELQDAYDQNQFCLYYQPKINMQTRDVIGFEALIRWQHPTQGVLPPASFLPAMTNQSLELKVGFWVIQEALNQMQAWLGQGIDQGVSVNLAGYQLQQPDFIPELRALIQQYPPSVIRGLELEILETSAIEDLATVSGVIEACKEMGIKMSLDDFGTGYSTLSHLKELSVDMLKIDHGFVRDMLDDSSDFAIIKGVIGFADAFSLQVIAEGVETPEHEARLISLGCHLGQGFYISPPMPADQVPQWYYQWNSDKE